MANNKDARVLQRLCARELKLDEIEKVRGAARLTLLDRVLTKWSGGYD
jgi:hypothetical protein